MCKLASLPWRALRITMLRRSGIMRGLLVVMLLPWEATGRVRRLIGWSGKQIEMSPKGGARCWREVNRNSPSHWLFSGECTDGEKQTLRERAKVLVDIFCQEENKEDLPAPPGNSLCSHFRIL